MEYACLLACTLVFRCKCTTIPCWSRGTDVLCRSKERLAICRHFHSGSVAGPRAWNSLPYMFALLSQCTLLENCKKHFYSSVLILYLFSCFSTVKLLCIIFFCLRHIKYVFFTLHYILVGYQKANKYVTVIYYHLFSKYCTIVLNILNTSFCPLLLWS